MEEIVYPFSDTSKTTINELRMIYHVFGERANYLEVIKGMKSSRYVKGKTNDYYTSESQEVWELLSRRFTVQLEKKKLHSIEELYAYMINWCIEHKDAL